MKTYQDLQTAIAGTTSDLLGFITSAINEHKSSDMYKTAAEADLYMRQLNPPIYNFRKLLYTLTGEAYPDPYAANHKCASNFLRRFVVQENQYLLGNGVTFENDRTKDKLGGADFDRVLQSAGEAALVGGVSFGLYNFDRVEVFRVTEFVPLWDEENGSLSAGIRFWQIDSSKPMRATLYEPDGYTDYIRRKGEDLTELHPKQNYKRVVRHSEADGTEIYDGGNYPSFPIVPLWGNPEHQSELTGIKTQIDAYDLIKSGFANDLDDASMIYWTISNAGGMDDPDLAEFIRRLKTIHAANTNEGTNIQSHTVEVPYQSRETYLTRLENDMYNDFMALNIRGIAAGNNTATAIEAAYEPLNNKADRYEYCVIQFIKGLLELAGVDDTPTFKRSKLVNMTEETNMVLAAANYLDDRTVLEHLPFISVDEIDEIIARRSEEELSRYDDTAESVTEETADGGGNNIEGVE
ncbi:MAG: phage portal protein [Ruminococcus sp.]|nr:phage portal protein [Ruminococcus sp.]MCM1380322.1 phage portal protein [Muribaculaceae bacterium]MCM1478234.1 phage portal protein [Muribaculaceae bacterium]